MRFLASAFLVTALILVAGCGKPKQGDVIVGGSAKPACDGKSCHIK